MYKPDNSSFYYLFLSCGSTPQNGTQPDGEEYECLWEGVTVSANRSWTKMGRA